MKAVSGTLMRSVEASAIQLGQVDSWSMMKRAGEALAREAMASTDITSKKEMGKLMAALKPQIAHRADGKTVSQLLMGLLS